MSSWWTLWLGDEGLYFIYCIHVHGHEQGRGNFRKHGMGTALLAAAEGDARQLGAKGMAAWGAWLPFWMRASWFRKHGYRKADRQGIAVLLWKPFADDAEPPRWLPPTGKRPEPIPGKVNVTAFSSGWCLAQNLVYERAKRAATGSRAYAVESGASVDTARLWEVDPHADTGPRALGHFGLRSDGHFAA
jgi:hypothetical protein